MTQRRRSNNLTTAWTAYHDQALPRILVDLGDGVDRSKVTGAAVKQHDLQFDRLDSSLLNRKIREYRKRSTTAAHRMVGADDDEAEDDRSTDTPLVIGKSSHPKPPVDDDDVIHDLPASKRTRTGLSGFESNLRLFEVVWWTSGTRASIFLSMVANHLIEYAVESSGRALVVTYTQKNVDPEFYINQTMKSNVLKYEESKSILHDFEGKEQERFTVRIPLPKKVEPDVDERYIFNENGPQYPVVLQLTLTAVKLAQYGVASQVQAL